MKTLRLLALVAALLAAVASTADAAPITYLMGDHSDAYLYRTNQTGPYGLRADQLPGVPGPVFSAGSNLGGGGGPLYLTYDPTNLAAGATLSGFIEHDVTGDLWSVTYNISGAGMTTAEGGNGFKATHASGIIVNTTNAADFLVLTSKQNGAGVAFEFDDDNHRNPIGGPWVARGWMLPNSTTDDWLLVGTPVPEPGTLALVGLAVCGIAARRRKKA